MVMELQRAMVHEPIPVSPTIAVVSGVPNIPSLTVLTMTVSAAQVRRKTEAEPGLGKARVVVVGLTPTALGQTKTPSIGTVPIPKALLRQVSASLRRRSTMKVRPRSVGPRGLARQGRGDSPDCLPDRHRAEIE